VQIAGGWLRRHPLNPLPILKSSDPPQPATARRYALGIGLVQPGAWSPVLPAPATR
jgi:hypothetical protein